MSLTDTPITQSIRCLIFLKHERTVPHLNYSGQESKRQSADYDFDTSVTLKQGQGHQTWFELVDSKQGCYNTNFEKSRLNSVPQKKSQKHFSSNQETGKLSPLHMHESKK